MPKPRIAVLSGPTATIANSPPLVTSNKARLPGERLIPGRFDHLVPQILFEPVTVKIKKFSAHPLEEDAAEFYHQDGEDYYEVTLTPEDGPYLLPYMARRADGSPKGVPFEASDLKNALIDFGGRQGFYPDASRIFVDIDRTISGRTEDGEGSILDRKAQYDFIRVLPSGGYRKRGEISGVHYFPYRPESIAKSTRVSNLAVIANSVQRVIRDESYEGAIWLEGTPNIEETLYWLSLLIDTDLPIVGTASQRAHGQLANDGDRNVVDAVEYILSGKGKGLGVVGIQDQRIYAPREFKKGDARPGGYKSTGGHGGILGSVKSGVTVWYRPAYRHTSTSEVNLGRLAEKVEFVDRFGDANITSIQIKKAGDLRGESVPRVSIVKHAGYSQDDETEDPSQEVDIMARISQALAEQNSLDNSKPKLHGLVIEGTSPYGRGTRSQMRALSIAAMSGMPVVRVGRSDPDGRVITEEDDLTIEGSNLDANKARLLLMASMLKLGRLPKAKDPRNPSSGERDAVMQEIFEFQEIFENH